MIWWYMMIWCTWWTRPTFGIVCSVASMNNFFMNVTLSTHFAVGKSMIIFVHEGSLWTGLTDRLVSGRHECTARAPIADDIINSAARAGSAVRVVTQRTLPLYVKPRGTRGAWSTTRVFALSAFSIDKCFTLHTLWARSTLMVPITWALFHDFFKPAHFIQFANCVFDQGTICFCELLLVAQWTRLTSARRVIAPSHTARLDGGVVKSEIMGTLSTLSTQSLPPSPSVERPSWTFLTLRIKHFPTLRHLPESIRTFSAGNTQVFWRIPHLCQVFVHFTPWYCNAILQKGTNRTSGRLMVLIYYRSQRAFHIY